MSKTYKKLESDLITSMNTEVLHEEEFQFNAPHEFIVVNSITEDPLKEVLVKVHFQEGPVKENALNGIFHEDLIAMIICRLEHFQKTPYACRENEMAIAKLEESLMWLRKRTNGRQKRNVMGTSKV